MTSRGEYTMEKENKRKYKKKNDFNIKIIFNEKGEKLESTIERAFANYCIRKIRPT